MRSRGSPSAAAAAGTSRSNHVRAFFARRNSLPRNSARGPSNFARIEAVAAGPADLLGVALRALRQVVVVDGADVRLVDAHAERDRRNHDRVRRGHEPVLNLGAHFTVETGVISAGVDACGRQPAGDLL